MDQGKVTLVVGIAFAMFFWMMVKALRLMPEVVSEFDIIGDEVHSLASRTPDTTKERHPMFVRFRSGVKAAATAMGKGCAMAEEQSAVADEMAANVHQVRIRVFSRFVLIRSGLYNVVVFSFCNFFEVPLCSALYARRRSTHVKRRPGKRLK